MPVSIAQGWDVMQAVNIQKISRLCVVGAGSWSRTAQPGLSGFNGVGSESDTTFMADSRAALDAMITWLVGSGAKNVLVTATDPPGTHTFGTHFLAGLTALGHTYTLTGAYNRFFSYDPVDYDLLISQDDLSTSETYRGMTDSAEKFDWLLTTGVPILMDMGNYTRMERYGFDDGGTWHTYHGPPIGPPTYFYQRPFYCAPFGGDLYLLVKYTTAWIESGTNIMGGTSVVYDCILHGADEGTIGLWDGLA